MRHVPFSPRMVWLVRHWPRQSFVVASILDATSRRLGSSRHPWYFRRRVTAVATWHPRQAWPFPCRVTGADPGSVPPPMILVSFHFGRVKSLGPLFEQLPGKVLILEHEKDLSPPRPGVERVTTGGGEMARIAAARRAADLLREDGFVFMLLDRGGDTAKTPIALFDRTFLLSSGAFQLARITGAPIMPVIAEWREGRLEIMLGTPIAPTEEAAMANTLASWLEDRFPEGDRRSRLIRALAG
jgi:hypothetical protein